MKLTWVGFWTCSARPVQIVRITSPSSTFNGSNELLTVVKASGYSPSTEIRRSAHLLLIAASFATEISVSPVELPDNGRYAILAMYAGARFSLVLSRPLKSFRPTKNKIPFHLAWSEPMSANEWSAPSPRGLKQDGLVRTESRERQNLFFPISFGFSSFSVWGQEQFFWINA